MQKSWSCISVAAAAAALFAALASALAQTFPSRPISVLVGASPGDPSDVVARLIQNRMAERLGQPWVVETRPGATGKIAGQAVARAAPDGHTLLVTLSAHAVSPAGQTPLPYDTVRDFAGVTMMARQPLVIAVHPSVKGDTFNGFLEAARNSPGVRLAYATPGAGSLSFLIGEEVVRLGKIEMTHVPFRGGSPAVQALLSNEVQLTALIPAILLPHIKAGTLKALAVTSAERIPELPDTPTLRELGFDRQAIYNWIGVFAPGATPKPIVDRLSREINDAVRQPETARALNESGLEIVASSPAELDQFVVGEIERWTKFTREFGVRFE